MDPPDRSHSTSPEPWKREQQQQQPAIPPPYWQTEQRPHARHIRGDSTASGPLISLVDNTGDESEQSRACWAKSARIQDYHVIGGGLGVLGSYVVYNCVVQTAHGSSMTIRKRYSEFDQLRDNLVHTFPNSKAAVPKLPPKGALHKFQTKFLEKRQEGLEYFLNCVICNPEFSASPVLKEFLFP